MCVLLTLEWTTRARSAGAEAGEGMWRRGFPLVMSQAGSGKSGANDDGSWINTQFGGGCYFTQQLLLVSEVIPLPTIVFNV